MVDKSPNNITNFLFIFNILVSQVSVLVICHTRELAFQISKEYERFSKFLPSVKVSYGNNWYLSW